MKDSRKIVETGLRRHIERYEYLDDRLREEFEKQEELKRVTKDLPFRISEEELDDHYGLYPLIMFCVDHYMPQKVHDHMESIGLIHSIQEEMWEIEDLFLGRKVV